MKENNKYESPRINQTIMETFSVIAASMRTEQFVLGDEYDFE